MDLAVLPYFSAGARFAGAVDYLEASVGIRGWVIEPDVPGAAVELEARCGGVALARSIAIMDRPDIDNVLGRTTQCGFLIGWSRFDRAALDLLGKSRPAEPLEFLIVGTNAVVPVVREPITVGECLALVRAAPKGDLISVFRELNEYLEADAAGIFDAAWYARHRALPDPGLPPLLDYLRQGEAAGAAPSRYFSPREYAAAAKLRSPAGALLHYIRGGGLGGAAPSLHFDTRWYRATHDHAEALPLAHYMAGRQQRGPNRWFDPAWYTARSGAGPVADPYEHFLTVGLAGGIPPSAEFDVAAAKQPRDGLAFLELLRSKVLPGTAAPAAAPAVAAPAAAPAEAKPAVVKPAAAKPAAAAPVERVLETVAASAPPKASTRARAAAEPTLVPAPPPVAAPARPAAKLPAAAPAPAGTERFEPLAAGFASTEAYLRELPDSELAAVVAQAERDVAAKGDYWAAGSLILAAARLNAGDRAASAAAQLGFLLATQGTTLPMQDEIFGRFALICHALYEARNRAEAVDVYRQLHQRGFRDLLVSLRLLEVELDTGNADRAAPYVLELERDYASRLNVWAFLAISRYYQLRGDVAACVLLLKQLPAVEPVAEAVVTTRLLESGAVDEAEKRLQAVPDPTIPELFQPRFRLAVRRGTVASILEQETARCAELPDWLLSEAMFLTTTPGATASPEQEKAGLLLYRLLETRPLDSRPVVAARIQLLFVQKRWDELGLLFRQLEGSPLANDRETLLRKLEYYCFADNPEEAERIYRQSFAGTRLNKWESLTILRLLSELKRWDDAGNVILGHCASGFGFAGGLHVAMRIVRKAGVHQALLAAVHAAPADVQANREPDLADFLHMVSEDLVIISSARALTGNGDSRQGATRYRSNWLLTNQGGEGSEETDYCLFLCTNQRYFLSLLTFLCSYMGQAPQVGGRIFVFLDRDVPRHWYGSVAMVAGRFGRAVDLVSEDDFMPKDGVEHRVEYGFFAGGSNLSRAAYFRLYATRYLLERFSFRRAVYTDTDIVCRSDLRGMFEMPLGDSLISARIEDYSADVVNAASRNDIDPLAYFNSGVLVLDFENKSLSQHIEEAIRISEVEPERLIFHDQCALNIAFKDRFTPLEPRFNFFLRPSRERNGYIEDAVLLHYLDKPKPWDIVFDRTYREEWRVWALVLGTILPQNLYVDIFAAGNRD